MNTKTIPSAEMRIWMNELLTRADVSSDVATKVDSDGKYIRTPWELCTEIVEKIKQSAGNMSDKKVLVVDTVEFIPVLLSFGVNKCNIVFVAPYEFKGKIASSLGATVVQDSLLTWKTNMKFDVVVGNPPYQASREGTTTTEDLYSKFVRKSISLKPQHMAMIIPSDWVGPNSSGIKNLLFNSGNLKKLCLYGPKWFNVAKDICCIFYEPTVAITTEIVDINNTTLNISLNGVSSISLDNKLTSFLLKFSGYSTYLDKRWLHGNLNLNKLHAVAGNSVEFIQAVGRKDAPLVTSFITDDVESTGYGLSKLVLPTVGLNNEKIGQIKLAKREQVGGHSVVFITASSDCIANNIKTYLETKTIRMLIKSVKKSTPNSKGLFSCIPEIDFTKKWTDDELYAYFNLTQDEIDYIEATIK